MNPRRGDTVLERDGYERTRFRGQARRGAPTRVAEDALDARMASTELRDAYELLVRAQSSDLTPSERRELHREAVERIRLANRFTEDVLRRADRSRNF